MKTKSQLLKTLIREEVKRQLEPKNRKLQKETKLRNLIRRVILEEISETEIENLVDALKRSLTNEGFDVIDIKNPGNDFTDAIAKEVDKTNKNTAGIAVIEMAEGPMIAVGVYHTGFSSEAQTYNLGKEIKNEVAKVASGKNIDWNFKNKNGNPVLVGYIK